MLDSEILAEVYIELIGGKQTALGLSMGGAVSGNNAGESGAAIVLAARPRPLAPRISDAERAAHAALVDKLGEKAIWKKY